MKKLLAALLIVLMITGTALAREATPSNGGRSEAQLYEELIVGTNTTFSGNFFGDMWGSNTSDIDVRVLLHAYSLVDWKAEEGSFAVNQTVVSGLISEIDEAGNKKFFVSLADGLMYSDGSPITAKDYVFSLLLSASGELAELGGMASRLRYVVGAEEYTGGESEMFSGVRLYGEKSFSVTIRAEYLPFFYELGLLSVNPYPIGVIAPGCEVADDGQGVYIRNISEKETKPVFTAELLEKTLLSEKDGYMTYPKVTSGAYRLVSYNEKTQMARFEINPYYIGDHEGKKPVIERLVFQVVHPDEMLAQLQDGSVDLLNKCLQASVIQGGMELRANMEGFDLQQYMRSGLGFISFNCERGPAQFQAVRQALAMCLDRDQFISGQVENFGQKVNGYYGMGQWMTQLVTGTLPAPLPELSENPSAEELQAYDDEAAAWDALTLDNLNDYALDLDAALALLVEDGWIFNQEGNPFDPTMDTVRAKLVDGAELMTLEMVMIVPEEGNISEKFLGMQENMKKIGAKLTIESMPYDELLKLYYRQAPRENDMFFMGTNFTTMFDPTSVYSIYDEDQGAMNTTGLRDEKLMNLAIDLYKTETGDVLGYVRKWVAFQEYWNEVLPMIPIYSNIYFDFYTNRLQDYSINQHITWGEAVLYAKLSDAVEEDTMEDSLPAGGTPIGGSPLEEEDIFLP